MTVIDFGAGARDDGYPQDRREAGWYAMQAEAHRFTSETDPAEQAEGFGARIARLLNYLGAVVSVMLMIGLMVWGYRLVTRDVSTVPVIRALAGESRVAPADPGGEATTHTGLAVNEVPAGVPSTPSPEIAIAPATVALAEEDVAMGALGATARIPGALSETPPLQPVTPVIAMPDVEARMAAEARAAEEAEAASALAYAEDAGADGLGLPPAADAPVDRALTDLDGEPVAEQAQAINAALLAAAEAPAQATAAVAASPRPAPRPQRVAAAAPVEAAAPERTPRAAVAEATPAPKARPEAEAAPAAKSVSPDSLPGGSMVVQIGAFDSDELARGEWSRVAGKNAGLFDGKSQIVQKTERNGRAFWRLRVAGFDSRDEARDFCASLKARGTDCIPTAAN